MWFIITVFTEVILQLIFLNFINNYLILKYLYMCILKFVSMTFSNPDFTIFFDILFWFQWFFNIFSDEDLHIHKALCPKECNCSWYKEKSEATLMSLNCQFSNSSNFPNFEDTPNMFQEITILSLKGYTSLKILNSSNLVPGEWLCMYCLNKILWTCYLLYIYCQNNTSCVEDLHIIY